VNPYGIVIPAESLALLMAGMFFMAEECDFSAEALSSEERYHRRLVTHDERFTAGWKHTAGSGNDETLHHWLRQHTTEKSTRATLMRRSTRRARGALQNELSPSAENVPPERRSTENIPLVRKSKRRDDSSFTWRANICPGDTGAAILSSVPAGRSLFGRWKT
jgi:hypothetical protein